MAGTEGRCFGLTTREMGPLASKASSPCFLPPRSKGVFEVRFGLVGWSLLIRGAGSIALRLCSGCAVFQRFSHVLNVVLVAAELWIGRRIVGVWGHDISFSGSPQVPWSGYCYDPAPTLSQTTHATGRTVGDPGARILQPLLQLKRRIPAG
jgi:hypothetical protein